MVDKIKISRTKIELFLECQRCFWLEAKYNIKRPEKFGGVYIGAKYDPLLKNKFDQHRKSNNKPEELKDYDFELYPHYEKLNQWRRNLEFYHPEHKITYYGKIDDLLINKNNELVPFDFKTTLSKDFQIYESYKRQLEMYGYFLKKQGEQVSSLGVFYVIKIDIKDGFEKIEKREVIVQENLDYEIYDKILDNLREVYFSEREPEPNYSCQFCQRDLSILKLK